MILSEGIAFSFCKCYLICSLCLHQITFAPVYDLPVALVPLCRASLGSFKVFSIFYVFARFLLSSFVKQNLLMKVYKSFYWHHPQKRSSESAGTSFASGFRLPSNLHFIKSLLKKFISWEVVLKKASASNIDLKILCSSLVKSNWFSINQSQELRILYDTFTVHRRTFWSKILVFLCINNIRINWSCKIASFSLPNGSPLSSLDEYFCDIQIKYSSCVSALGPFKGSFTFSCTCCSSVIITASLSSSLSS